MRGVLTLKPSYYEALKRLTLELAGINLGTDHAFLVETRLAHLARKEGFETLTDMIEELFSSGQSRLAVQTVSALLERDTQFYSDPDSYKTFENTIMPQLHRAYKGGTIRILSFGCASGQEAYGMAMQFDKCKDRFPDLKVEITGVDYPSAAIDRARTGRYTHFDVQRGLPIRDLVAYFERKGEDWQIKDCICQYVTFTEFHLLTSLEELGQFHVVMFRNGLPHYSSPAQVRVLRGMSNVVRPLGYLMLGSTETLNHINYGFDPVDNVTGIFQRREPKIEPEPEDPTVKKPTGRKTFEKTKRRVKSLIDESHSPKKSA